MTMRKAEGLHCTSEPNAQEVVHVRESQPALTGASVPSVRREFAPRRRRLTLLTSNLGRIETLERRNPYEFRSAEDFSPEFQVCLPYSGLFVWHVGHDDVIADANQVLFVTAGEAFRLSEPGASGFSELIITPSLDLLSEIVRTSARQLSLHPLFARRSCRASFAIQHLTARTLHALTTRPMDPLEQDEWLVELLRTVLDVNAPRPASALRTRRLIRYTKEFLDGHAAAPLRLCDIARAVNASPAYLTDLFRRHEGIALHRYLVQLRLARALVELPHTDNLTALAFDLGFSSHSHFAAAFRRAFRCTPSEYRAAAGCRGRRFPEVVEAQ
jgi:AraC-like DNA-binding protein